MKVLRNINTLNSWEVNIDSKEWEVHKCSLHDHLKPCQSSEEVIQIVGYFTAKRNMYIV